MSEYIKRDAAINAILGITMYEARIPIDSAVFNIKRIPAEKDLISRCELFNRLATIPAPPEANDFKAEIYKVIQSMEAADQEQNEDFNPCPEYYDPAAWE